MLILLSLDDVMNQSVIIDNVMVNKSALEMLKCGRSGSSLSNLGEITGSFRSQSTDQSCKLKYFFNGKHNIIF